METTDAMDNSRAGPARKALPPRVGRTMAGVQRRLIVVFPSVVGCLAWCLVLAWAGGYLDAGAAAVARFAVGILIAPAVPLAEVGALGWMLVAAWVSLMLAHPVRPGTFAGALSAISIIGWFGWTASAILLRM